MFFTVYLIVFTLDLHLCIYHIFIKILLDLSIFTYATLRLYVIEFEMPANMQHIVMSMVMCDCHLVLRMLCQCNVSVLVSN